MMSSASPSSQCGRRADVPSARLARRLAPGPDRDVGLLAADRDVRVGGFGMRSSRSSSSASTAASSASIAVDPLAGARSTPSRSSATSGPSGLAPPWIASPICFEAVLRSALSASASARSRRRSASSSSARSTSAGSSPLSIAPWRMRLGLLAEPLQADAHAGSPPSAAAAAASRKPARCTNAAVEAGQQPAGARPVGPAEEREVERGEGAAGAAGRAPAAAAKIAACHASPLGGRVAVGGLGERRRKPRCSVVRARPPRRAARRAGPRSARAPARTPRASARAAARRSSRIGRSRVGQRRSPSPARRAPTTSTPGTWTSSARCANAGRNAAASAATSAVGSSSE